MLYAILGLFGLAMLLAMAFENYWRLEEMARNHRRVLSDARREINALNTIVLMRFKHRQSVDNKILQKLLDRMEKLETKMTDADIELSYDIDALKSTLHALMSDEKILYDYSDTQARLREQGQEKFAQTLSP